MNLLTALPIYLLDRYKITGTYTVYTEQSREQHQADVVSDAVTTDMARFKSLVLLDSDNS